LLQLEKFCHLAADGIHETLLRPEHDIEQDHLKFVKHSVLFERMQKKIDRDYASTFFAHYNVCGGEIFYETGIGVARISGCGCSIDCKAKD